MLFAITSYIKGKPCYFSTWFCNFCIVPSQHIFLEINSPKWRFFIFSNLSNMSNFNNMPWPLSRCVQAKVAFPLIVLSCHQLNSIFVLVVDSCFSFSQNECGCLKNVRRFYSISFQNKKKARGDFSGKTKLRWEFFPKIIYGALSCHFDCMNHIIHVLRIKV